MLDKIIRESDAIAGFDHFHKRSAILQEIANYSAGIAGWARFERKAQQREGEAVQCAPRDFHAARGL